MKFQRIKGTKDILPSEVYRWQYVERIISEILENYSYKEIRTPAFEMTELFSRSVGTDTDIVSKEMYTFLDKGKQSLTLKPELTAPVIRSFIQNHLDQVAPVTKVYYLDALFRQERPQKGRLRQFHQFGCELVGSEYPEADAEIIKVVYDIYKELGIKAMTLRLNSIGSRNSRRRYLDVLRDSLKPHLQEFCAACQQRLEKNILRLFDCKAESCQSILDEYAPSILEYLDDSDLEHFESLKNLLELVNIDFTVDHKLVRGLDYYTRTTFEITSPLLGAQDALCGGGRYDHLVEDLGGKTTPAVGVAAGMERLLLALDELNAFPPEDLHPLYISTLGERAREIGFKLRAELIESGVESEMDFLRRSLKAQMREAGKKGANWVVIIGDSEIDRGVVILKNMTDSTQTDIPIDSASQKIIKAINR